MIALGLMSGTSLDGIDAALVDIRPRDRSYALKLLKFETRPYDDDVYAALKRVMPPNAGSASQLAELHKRIGMQYADAAAHLAGDHRIDFAAMHGQTAYHDGDRALTLQAGSPYFLRDRLRTTVCFDFRSADCALGGHGAPLVPYVDSLLLTSPDEDRVAINIGGIANLTFLPAGAAPQSAVAFDSGPGNMLIDAFVQERSGGKQQFDDEGALAARGRVDDATLQRMLADEYFGAPAPKSTGRERFGLGFLASHATRLQALSLQDGAATLTELTAATIADAVRRLTSASCRVFVSGGGVHNNTLMRALRKRLAGYDVETTTAMNLNPDAKEAIAFAVLGYETLRGRPANLPRVTGASAPAVLGAIAPYELEALLRSVRAECAE